MDFADVLSMLAMILITIPSSVIFILHSILYIIGSLKGRPCTALVKAELNKYCIGHGSILVSIIIPVRKEPIDLIDDALANIYSWSIRDLIEVIIVSDDSWDDAEKVFKLVDTWRRRGLRILLLWRSEPRGFRTGALNDGLRLSAGKYIYIMDVDSRVSESFILKAINTLEKHSDVVAVVARWKAKNKDTRLSQAVAASMDYIVDSIYRGRASLGLPVFPVGTGTIYKAWILKDLLGGWDEDRIQDDMEIGSRIMGLNLRVEYIDDEIVFVEVPRRYRSFKIQQERWAYGAVDVAVSRLKSILVNKFPLIARLESLLFLLQYMPLALTYIGAFMIIFVNAIYGADPIQRYMWLGFIWLATAILYILTFIDSCKNHGGTAWGCLVNLGRISAATVALSPRITMSIIKALLRLRLAYKRTPKGSFELVGYGSLKLLTEEVITLMILLPSAIIAIFHGFLYSGLWLLVYSSGFIYTIIRWGGDILFK